MPLTLPATGTVMNTEVIASGSLSGDHNQAVYLADALGARIAKFPVDTSRTTIGMGASVTHGSGVYGSTVQVGSTFQLLSAAPTGLYDASALILDVGGLVKVPTRSSTATTTGGTTTTVDHVDEPVLFLFDSDQTANLPGSRVAWEIGSALDHFAGVVRGFESVSLSSTTGAQMLLANGQINNPGNLWGVIVGGSGATATGSESLFMEGGLQPS